MSTRDDTRARPETRAVSAESEILPRAPRAAWVPVLLLALVVALVGRLVYVSMAAAPQTPSADDRYYLRYMQAVHDGGFAAFPALFDQWNTTRGDWIFPPPSRVGFIGISALWAGIFGASFHALQMLSFAAYLATCVVNYACARRRLGEPRALFVGALIAFSPLFMGISRLALTDSLIALCMTSTVWLFLEVLEDPTKLLWRVLFMCALAVTVLVKELSVLVAVPLGLFVLYERFVRRVPRPLGTFALCFALPALVTAPIFVLAAGSPAKLLETTRIVLSSPATNDYAVRYGSGPWSRTAVDFLLFSPWATLLAVGWFAVVVARSREATYDRLSTFFAFVTAAFVLELGFFTKNVRYTAVLEVPIRVFAVLMMGGLTARLRPRLSVGLTAAAVALLCWFDWRTFELVWVKYQAYDPVTYLLAVVREVMPRPTR